MLSPPNKRFSNRPRTRLASLLFFFAWLGLLAALALNRQNLQDWWMLRNYQVPAVVEQIATQDTMTDYGRKLFFVNHPQLVSRADFSRYCPLTGGEQTIVLGCYHSGKGGIYLRDVNDPRLEGVEQLTAAHEMLHAAYDRLDAKERGRVDKLLQDYYKNELKDARILKSIDAYRESEPEDLVNEMHSIFGTEVVQLPVALEDYYKRYFKDRRAVAAFAERYQAEFTNRQDIVDRADAELERLKIQIDNLEADLNVKQANITGMQATLNNQRGNGEIAAYNAGVPVYNNMIDTYNAQIEQVRSLIARYNQLINERNAVALEEDALSRELKSDPIKN